MALTMSILYWRISWNLVIVKQYVGTYLTSNIDLCTCQWYYSIHCIHIHYTFTKKLKNCFLRAEINYKLLSTLTCHTYRITQLI